MKLLNLLLVVLLFACNDDSTDTPASKEPTNIVVEMTLSDKGLQVSRS